MYRIMVVDDEPAIGELFKIKIESSPLFRAKAEYVLDVRTAKTLLSQRWDLIVTDIHMPEICGLEFLKALSLTSEQKVLVTSSYLNEEKKRVAWGLGATDFVHKSEALQRLDEYIHSCLSLSPLQGGKPASPIQQKLEAWAQTMDLSKYSHR